MHTTEKSLTVREFQILKYMVAGLSNPKIAKKLKITESTVKAHVSSIIRKLKVTNRIEVVVKALKLDMI